jgi:hypothetical protein
LELGTSTGFLAGGVRSGGGCTGYGSGTGADFGRKRRWVWNWLRTSAGYVTGTGAGFGAWCRC